MMIVIVTEHFFYVWELLLKERKTLTRAERTDRMNDGQDIVPRNEVACLAERKTKDFAKQDN
jgi:hypothetical protein